MSIERTRHGTWRVRWREAGWQKARTFPTEHEAIAFDETRRLRSDAGDRDRALRLGQLIDGAVIVGTIDPRAHHVYVLWGDDRGRPLYVGQSRQVLTRLSSHMQDPQKKIHVRHITVLRCVDDPAMCELERSLIDRHQPPFNVAGIRAQVSA